MRPAALIKFSAIVAYLREAIRCTRPQNGWSTGRFLALDSLHGLTFRRGRSFVRDDLDPAIGVWVERVDPVFLAEGEAVLVVGVGENERAAEHEALARLLLFASGSAVALGEQFVDDVGAGVPVGHLDRKTSAAAITRTPNGLLRDQRVLDEPGQRVRVD